MHPVAQDGVACSVGLSHCKDQDPCKMAEPIKMPFGMLTQMGPRNYVLDGVQIPATKRGTVEGDVVGISPHAAEHCPRWP